MWPLVLTSLVAGWVPVVPWLLASSETLLEGLLSLFSTLTKAHLGYLHWVSALLRWAFLFGEKLRIATYCLGPIGKGVDNTKLGWEVWWLSHCRYWSVWVGFLYIVMDRFPSVSGFTTLPKKGMTPSSLLFSTVNWMTGSTLLICCRKSFLWIFFWMTNVSSTYLHQSLGVGEQYWEPFVQSIPYIG